MKALVTGATGFIGAAVARAALAADMDVRLLVRSGADRRNVDALEAADAKVVLGDLTDHDSLQRAVAGCDALFHVAADYRLWTGSWTWRRSWPSITSPTREAFR